MNNIEISFIFPCTNCLLLTAMFILLAGALITMSMMSATTGFIYTNGTPMQRIKIPEWPMKYPALENLFLNTSEVTKQTIRSRLKIDFYFMPCAYLFLLCLGFYTQLNLDTETFLENIFNYIIYLPMCSWVFDIGENILALKQLNELSKPAASWLYAASICKWASVFIYVGFLAILVVVKLLQLIIQ